MAYQKRDDDRWARYACQSMLGSILAMQKQYAEAEPMLLSGYQGILQRESTIAALDRIELARAGERIVELYRGWEKPDRAAEWRARLESAKSSAPPVQRWRQ